MDVRGQSSGSQLEVAPSHQGITAMPADIFCCHNYRQYFFIQSVEARDVFKYPTTHRTAPYHKELSDPKCQQSMVERNWDKRESYLKSSYYNIIGKDPMVLSRTLNDQVYLGDCQNLQCKLPLRIQIERQGLNSVIFGKMQTLG